MEIFAFSGKMGSGKDYLARVLQQMLPQMATMFLSFADAFKLEAIAKYGLDRERVYGQKDEKTRVALQICGTEEGRMKFGADIWIKFARETMLEHYKRGIRRFIITDVRFANEFEFLKQQGATIFRVIAPIRTRARVEAETSDAARQAAICAHISECDLDFLDTRDDATRARDDAIRVRNDANDDAVSQMRDFVINRAPPVANVFLIDLDETIVHCNQNYNGARDLVASQYGIEPRAFCDQLQSIERGQELFQRDLFARHLIDTVRHFKTISRDEEAGIRGIAMSVYNAQFPPIAGAIETLRAMHEVAQIIIVTLGERADQVRKLAKIGVLDICYGIETTTAKNVSFYRAVMAKYPARNYHIFGDSDSRDIRPAIDAGIRYTYHIHPSHFADIGAAFARAREIITQI